MSNDKRYNGWTNYETWNVNLWLTNEEGSDSLCREWAQECYDDAEASDGSTREETASLVLADRIDSLIRDEWYPQELTGLYKDLLGAALSEVNWYEIAEHFVEDVDKATAEDAV